MIAQHFDFGKREKHWSQLWKKSNLFASNPDSNKPKFSINMPPPNVTGSLHCGHALTYTLPDILCRFKRMQGFDVLWQPGQDHAGIATQMLVERSLAKQGMSKYDLGREKFIEKIWEWRHQYGDKITHQLESLGVSADWSRTRFTMDEPSSNAVIKTFVDLYKQGKIYRDKRLVNWDAKLQTALSDLEVNNTEAKGHLWHLRYPLATPHTRTDGTKLTYITVATTRPETLLGDSAVAVHPEDPRYKDLIGSNVLIPLSDRAIPIIADEHADPETGSGAVKITPAHDFNDFEVGKRHNLPMHTILDMHAHMAKDDHLVPLKYQDIERLKARQIILEDLDALGLIDKIDDHTLMLPLSERTGEILEPLLLDQWYVDTHDLAAKAMEAVKSGKTRFTSKMYENTFFRWMENIQPWCVSRQIWWGHQIPAWYGPDGHPFVALSEKEAMIEARAHYNTHDHADDPVLTRDPDVLDTWFSSGLWPFSTLDWPNDTKELGAYYPTSVMITGADILFFWVARMLMMGCHFMDDVPFKDIYLHSLVTDEHGQKMSKTKGNVIDPLELMGEYGTDALRMTLATAVTQGRNIRLSPMRVEGFRNFTTKLWNASKFCLMNEAVHSADYIIDPVTLKHPLNNWILSKLDTTSTKIAHHLDQYQFNLAADEIYDFIWHSICDWMIEASKIIWQNDTINDDVKNETRQILGFVMKSALKMLHPFMPYLTEELYTEFKNDNDPAFIMQAAWPDFSDIQGSMDQNKAKTSEIDDMIALVGFMRALKSDLPVANHAWMDCVIRTEDNTALSDDSQILLSRLARIHIKNDYDDDAIDQNATFVDDVCGRFSVRLYLPGDMDVDAEKAKLLKKIKDCNSEIIRIDKKLGNPKFVENAPEAVISKEKAKHTDYTEQKTKLEGILSKLG